MRRLNSLLACVLGLCSLLAQADVLRVAVASNFRPALSQLLSDFHQRFPHIEVQVSAGASGQLYAQILQGAPYDLYLSADSHYPALLQQQALAQTPQTYAHGRLLLISHATSHSWQQALAQSSRIAIANPDLAPYGSAARQLLSEAQLWPPKARLITGNNVAQVQHWFNHSHVDAAFAAASLQGAAPTYQMFDLTPLLSQPIEQQLTVLARSQVAASAQLLVSYLRGPVAQAKLAKLGYVPLTQAAR